jgi:Txe/YoeB family toxin of toxin-antitoxin system
MYDIVFTKDAEKDFNKVKNVKAILSKLQTLLSIIENNPFQNPPPCEKLSGNLDGAYSRRLNIQHRLIYEVIEDEKVVKVLRCWTHYE